jgi:ribosomal protein S10
MDIGDIAMSVMTIEGIVDNGQIKLKGDVRLPEKTKVYVVVPDVQVEEIQLESTIHIYSPRITNPEQAADLRMEMIEETPSANI